MHSANVLPTLFIQIGLILLLSRILGWLFVRIHQPQVMGEMIAGILLGPSLLGWLSPTAFQTLFPPDSIGYLQILSQVGIVLFLFLIGLELDPALLRARGRSTAVIGTSSIVVPFVLGVVVTVPLYRRLFDDPSGDQFLPAMLFMGAAMGITAFPVLARMLAERNLHKSPVGTVSIACAALNDVAAWCILAVVVAIAQEYAGPRHAVFTALFAVVYLAVMFLLVRPFLRRLEMLTDQRGRVGQGMLALILLLMLASAYATERIGIHALFGAFVLGFIMPKGTLFVRQLRDKLEDFTVVFLLPLFFAYTGLYTRINLLSSPALWGYALLLILVACVGKFGGTAVAARIAGTAWRESFAIGALMNTRGLMELVILNVGRELGVISDAVFAMMVLMAIATTALTGPMLNWIYPSRLVEPRPARPPGAPFSILIPISKPKSGGPLVNIADAIVGPDRARGRLLALNLREPDEEDAYRSGAHPELPRTPSDAAATEALTPLLAQAKARGLAVEPITLAAADVSDGIAGTAAQRQADLVLMGFHNPVFGKSMLGGTVHRVLAQCPAHVGVFVDRGLRVASRILVPYLGGPHDRLALELAARMARNVGARVTVLHVVPPMRGDAARAADARGAVDRAFDDPATRNAVTLKVVEDTSPVGVVVHQAQQYDLVVIGVSEEWGLESHLFGWRPERIARDCPCSLLIVRHYQAPADQPVPSPAVVTTPHPAH